MKSSATGQLQITPDWAPASYGPIGEVAKRHQAPGLRLQQNDALPQIDLKQKGRANRPKTHKLDPRAPYKSCYVISKVNLQLVSVATCLASLHKLAFDAVNALVKSLAFRKRLLVFRVVIEHGIQNSCQCCSLLSIESSSFQTPPAEDLLVRGPKAVPSLPRRPRRARAVPW